MTVLPNGTDAKDITLHFINMTTGRATPAIMKKTVMQAKTLLSNGYSKDEIIETIDYLIKIKGIDMYSLGYVTACINDAQRDIRKLKEQEALKALKTEVKAQIENMNDAKKEEVINDDDSTQRNRDKLARFGVQQKFSNFEELFNKE